MHTTPHTQESRKKMSDTKKGKHYSRATEFKKGQTAPNKGKRITALDGNTNGFGKGHTPWNKGLKGVHHHTEETKRKISETTKGEGGNNWKGGITPENRIGRTSAEYRAWQGAVFHRDNYTCQVCDVYGEYLHADHIKPYAHHSELRYDVENGRTLCRACHYYITFKRKMPSNSKWGLRQRKTG